MDQWVLDWLKERRAAGEKCLEVKHINNSFYVYHSTSHYDKTKKFPVKTSNYIGRLDPVLGLIEGKKRTEVTRFVTDWQYGNALLLDRAMAPLLPALREAFPHDYDEIFALAMVRARGEVPLKRAKDSWEELYNVRGLAADMNASSLGAMLRRVGLDRRGQDVVFHALDRPGRRLIYDLSCFFTHSDEIVMAEAGHNKDNLHLKQLSIALLCGLDDQMPAMLRVLPGSVRDVATLAKTVLEVGGQGQLLVMGRDLFSEEVLRLLEQKGINYIQPAGRNSPGYETEVKMDEHLMHHDRLVRCGKLASTGRFLYLFEDVKLRAEEETTHYQLLDAGKETVEEVEASRHIWGKILIISNLDIKPEEVYRLYKRRDAVEKIFDTYKNVLNADRTYLQDDASIVGHVFVAFLSLYAYCSIQGAIRAAGQETHLSPLDVLQKYSKVHRIDIGGGELTMEIPQQVRELDKALGYGLFPKTKS